MRISRWDLWWVTFQEPNYFSSVNMWLLLQWMYISLTRCVRVHALMWTPKQTDMPFQLFFLCRSSSTESDLLPLSVPVVEFSLISILCAYAQESTNVHSEETESNKYLAKSYHDCDLTLANWKVTPSEPEILKMFAHLSGCWYLCADFVSLKVFLPRLVRSFYSFCSFCLELNSLRGPSIERESGKWVGRSVEGSKKDEGRKETKKREGNVESSLFHCSPCSLNKCIFMKILWNTCTHASFYICLTSARWAHIVLFGQFESKKTVSCRYMEELLEVWVSLSFRRPEFYLFLVCHRLLSTLNYPLFCLNPLNPPPPQLYLYLCLPLASLKQPGHLQKTTTISYGSPLLPPLPRLPVLLHFCLFLFFFL